MSSKVYFFGLVSLASLLIFAGKHFNEQDQLAYTDCMAKHSSNNYCQVLIWGR
ncbi:hypothetical protein MedDCM-OCT-S16-C5-cds21 [uncultured Mediterranean phage MEDS3 group]|nr:hypothetical protein MedDCM-OCT-S16-C5-cds21 [uncultured Mediterranean phage MEDS3 group]